MIRVRRSRAGAAALSAAVLLAACTSGSTHSATTSSLPTPVAQTAPATSSTVAAVPPQVELRKVAAFGTYDPVPLLNGSVRYAGPPTPTSLDGVLLVDGQQPESLPPGTAEMLARQGFAVVGGRGLPYFHEVYKSESYSHDPLFVTTDALYHSWHVAFDKVLRDTEQQYLLPKLEHLLRGAVAAARAQQKQLTGTPLASDAERATAYYEAAAELLGLGLGTTSDRAAQEVNLARQAIAVAKSPVSAVTECGFPDKFDGCVDYSLFLPRGHYTRTADLKRYFAGMSLLGQEWFGLSATADAVRPGLLVTRVLTTSPALLADWKAIYEPTAFLVGLADDVTPLEVADATDRIAAGWREDPTRLERADTRAIASAVLASHPTKIDPERAGIRLMGARFTLDGYILDQMAWPNVGTNEMRRVDVSALDVAAPLGSGLARSIQLASGQGAFKNYEPQLDAMTALVAARQPSDWAGTVYDAWLAALQPVLVPHNAAYPDFMQNPAWTAKSLQTGLASYSELKHDTILYAKQGSAGEGEGPEPPPFTPRHWVEPEPVAFDRLASASALLRDGLAKRGLLAPADATTLDTFGELSTWLAGIATRELAGHVATDKENDRLASIGSELEALWFASADTTAVEGQPVASSDDSDAVVADIFRSSNGYLEVGTGQVDTIYVLVPIGDGRFELAVGAVSSYYEFRRPATELRLTDEEWKTLLAQTPVPVDRPSWEAPFLTGAKTSPEPVPSQKMTP